MSSKTELAITGEPAAGELRKLLRFRQEAGQIWLGEHRMVLLHAEYLRGLRDELMATLGLGRAQGVLFRMGFASGQADAELVRSLLPGADIQTVMRLGPQIHGLEGLVVGTIERLELDVETGHYLADASWQSSWESEVQLEAFGESKAPSCFSQTGYASGYASALMGTLVIFKELACLSCGAAACRIVGRPAAEWGSDDPWVRLLEPDNLQFELASLREKVAKLEERLDVRRSQGALVGASKKFYEALDLLGRASGSSITVLLTGETGVGKEAFARWVHANSSRAGKPFVAINCGAIPEDLIESELFGVDAGAFTGAKAGRPGRFERADGGTIMLDELGELSLGAQVKLLRVLQTGEVERLGGVTTRQVDVRVIAATNVELEQAVADRRFRQDLFYRVNSFPVRIAPLRERRADILPLVELFLATAQQRHGRSISGLSDMASNLLVAHDWPGNVRELENVIERAVVLATDGGEIGVDHLLVPERAAPSDAGLDVEGRLSLGPAESDPIEALLDGEGGLRHIEHLLTEKALARTKGNVSAAARLLGLTRPQLDYRIRNKSISLPR